MKLLVLYRRGAIVKIFAFQCGVYGNKFKTTRGRVDIAPYPKVYFRNIDPENNAHMTHVECNYTSHYFACIIVTRGETR